jgi:hypothetical protein
MLMGPNSMGVNELGLCEVVLGVSARFVHVHGAGLRKLGGGLHRGPASRGGPPPKLRSRTSATPPGSTGASLPLTRDFEGESF